MGIELFIIFWVAIVFISLLIISHNKKVREEEQERQRQERKPRQKKSSLDLPKTSGKLDPRNPRTYRNAGRKQLFIDGIPIFRYGSGENWTVARKPVTEEDFVDWIRINVKKQHFQTPEDRQKYYRDYVQWYYDSNNMSKNVYGGFKFTDGMLELSSHLSDEKRENIGQIFTELLRSDPRAYRFQQELFDKHTGVDPLFFAKIALAASFQVEQELLADYYHECEFGTEEEVYKYFNNSQYLKKYPCLREKAIKDALKWKIGKDSE